MDTSVLFKKMSVSSGPDSAPWFGRKWEHKHAIVAGIGSFVLCWIYWFGTRIWAPDYVPGVIEFSGTTTSLWSVWITQKRNVLALPIGIVSVILMGWFFLQIDLLGQTFLHWGYYLPVQFWAWSQWTRGGENQSELTVTLLKNKERLIGMVFIVVFTLILGNLLNAGWESAVHTYWDASIVAASIVAMVLLSRKKVESWLLWILPVNVSAIILYFITGAFMFSALYILFLIMAFVGLFRWILASKVNHT